MVYRLPVAPNPSKQQVMSLESSSRTLMPIDFWIPWPALGQGCLGTAALGSLLHALCGPRPYKAKPHLLWATWSHISKGSTYTTMNDGIRSQETILTMAWSWGPNPIMVLIFLWSLLPYAHPKPYRTHKGTPIFQNLLQIPLKEPFTGPLKGTP